MLVFEDSIHPEYIRLGTCLRKMEWKHGVHIDISILYLFPLQQSEAYLSHPPLDFYNIGTPNTAI